MKINKLNFKHGAKILALSIALVTSGISMTGCAKKVDKVVVKVDADASLLDLSSEYVKLLIETGNAFVGFEPVESDRNCVRLPLGYSLYKVSEKDCHLGMIGISVEDGYNVYQLGYSINDDGTRTPNTTAGCLGIHDAVIKVLDIRDELIADLQSDNPQYGYKVDDVLKNEIGNYRVVVSDGYDLVYTRTWCTTDFEKIEYEGGLIYNISAENLKTYKASIDDFMIVRNDVVDFFSLASSVYTRIFLAYEEFAEKGKVESKVHFSR